MSSIVAAGNLDKTTTTTATSTSHSQPPGVGRASNSGPNNCEEKEKTKEEQRFDHDNQEDENRTSERTRRRSERLLKKTTTSSAATSPDSSRRAASGGGDKMLSKIKSAEAVSSVARRTRASSFSNHLQKQQQQQQQQQQQKAQIKAQNDQEAGATSDTEDLRDTTNNDSNNNNLDAKQEAKQHQDGGEKKSQEELMEIVDSSRKRRLSTNSADSLSSFIRWSFNNIDQQQQQQQHKLVAKNYSQQHNHRHHHHSRTRRGSFSAFAKQHTIVIENNNNNTNMKSLARGGNQNDQTEPDSMMLDDEDDWSSLSHNNNNNNTSYQNNNNHSQHHHHLPGKLSAAEKLFRHVKLESGGNSAANLAILRHQQSQLAMGGQQEAQQARFKRQRTQAYSPESGERPFVSLGASAGSASTANRKVSSYLGNVVERLHEQNKREQRPQPPAGNADVTGNEQSCELEVDSTRGVEPANHELSFHLQQFLAQQTSLEDLCSSVGLDDSNQLVLAAAIHRALVDSVGPNGGSAPSGGAAQTSVDSKSTTSSTGSGCSSSGTGANNRRTYNTRGNETAPSGVRHSGGTTAANSTAATLAALNINSRVQQQRHAQAAAALSALASAGSQQQQHLSSRGHSQQLHNHHPHHQQHHHHHHQLVPNTLNTLANVATSEGRQLPSSAGQPASATSTGAPNQTAGMVDFECDTCGSSFDDRHRLMQHQSIHLELKKDWFNETPVDEVMKIFNRRRGEFLCTTCNLRFEATFDYDKHNHQVHGQRPYCCQFCGNGTRTFRFWRQYLNHLYDHRYIFSCTIDDCDFTVNRRDSLRFHIFRFHLNCQLPQQQTHIRSAGHHNMMALGDSKWPVASMDAEHLTYDDDLDQDRDQDDPMMSIGE